MSKILDLSGETEQHLIAVIDAALKAGGWSIIKSVDILRNFIKEQELVPSNSNELQQ